MSEKDTLYDFTRNLFRSSRSDKLSDTMDLIHHFKSQGYFESL